MSDTAQPIATSEGAALLLQTNISSLDILMSRDLESAPDEDIDKIVASLRAQRANWNIAEAAGKTRAPKAKAAKPGSIDLTGMTL